MTTVTKETNLVNIGVKIDEASVKATSDAVIAMLDAGARNHTNDEVMLKALSVLKASATIENLTFNGFNISSDNSKKTEIIVKMDDETETEVTTGVKVENKYANVY